jgi:hypothetical protein
MEFFQTSTDKMHRPIKGQPANKKPVTGWPVFQDPFEQPRLNCRCSRFPCPQVYVIKTEEPKDN